MFDLTRLVRLGEVQDVIEQLIGEVEGVPPNLADLALERLSPGSMAAFASETGGGAVVLYDGQINAVKILAKTERYGDDESSVIRYLISRSLESFDVAGMLEVDVVVTNSMADENG